MLVVVHAHPAMQRPSFPIFQKRLYVAQGPGINLVGTLMSLNGVRPHRSRETARLVIRCVTASPTRHTSTNAEVIQQFLEIPIRIDREESRATVQIG